ncbi:hypothetical protein [Roseibium marinum]|uniref:Uncharacterized protein n=1 Tax=Roseibium marinum TaxID=281252 RepID=A0A2S3US72_9HYPH|nr:hypothetical protein [Roseibium marinum]POF30572.1 hypothetical protein CLV41_106186 [Roseibium marinum]
MKSPPNLGPAEVPFPQARMTQARRDEDAFLEVHGGAGCVVLFQIVEGIASGGDPLWRRIVKILRAVRHAGPQTSAVSKQEHV